MSPWGDTLTEQLRGDIFIDQQHGRSLQFDHSHGLWQDRRTMPGALSALCQAGVGCANAGIGPGGGRP